MQLRKIWNGFQARKKKSFFYKNTNPVHLIRTQLFHCFTNSGQAAASSIHSLGSKPILILWCCRTAPCFVSFFWWEIKHTREWMNQIVKPVCAAHTSTTEVIFAEVKEAKDTQMSWKTHLRQVCTSCPELLLSVSWLFIGIGSWGTREALSFTWPGSRMTFTG